MARTPRYAAALLLSLLTLFGAVEPGLAALSQSQGPGSGARVTAAAVAAPAFSRVAALKAAPLSGFPALQAGLTRPLAAEELAGAVSELIRAAEAGADAEYLEAAAEDLAALQATAEPALAAKLLAARSELLVAAGSTERAAVAAALERARLAFSENTAPSIEERTLQPAELFPGKSSRSPALAPYETPASVVSAAIPSPTTAVAPAASDAKSPFSFPAYRWLLGTQVLMGLADNMLKSFLMLGLLGASATYFGFTFGSAALVGMVGASMSLSWPFLAGYAGRLTDRKSKTRVIQVINGLAIGVLAASSAALTLFPLTTVLPFLFAAAAVMGAHALAFGTARDGVMPQLMPKHLLPKAVGVITAASFLMVIVAFPIGALLLNALPAGAAVAVMAVTAALGWLASLKLPRTEPAGGGDASSILSALKDTKRNSPDILRAMLGFGFFAFLASLAITALPSYGKDLLGLSGLAISGLQALTGLGIAVGSTLAGVLSHNRAQLGFVGLGTVGLAVGALLLTMPALGLTVATAAFAILGVSAGFFMVPLNTYIQERSDPAKTGTNVGLGNWMFGIATFLGSFAFTAIGMLHASPALAFGAAFVATTSLGLYMFWRFPADAIRAVATLLVPLIYRVKVRGLENVPVKDGAVLAGNHVSLMDGIFVGAAVPRHLRFMMAAALFKGDGLLGRMKRWLLETMKVIAISRELADYALGRGVADLKAGRVVTIFPEGEVTRIGQMLGFKKRGVETLAREGDAPIIPFFLDGVWGSIFSFERGRFLKKMPKALRYPVSVRFGKALPPTATADQVRDSVMELGAQSFRERLDSMPSLFRGFLNQAKRNWGELAMVDRPNPDKPERDTKLSFGRALVASILLSGALQSRLPADRKNVGVLIPATVGAALSNVTLTGMGKVPVNLNFVMNRDNMKASLDSLKLTIDKGELGAVVTSEKVLARFNIPKEALGPNVILLEDVMKEVKSASALKRASVLFAAWALPASFVERLFFPNASKSLDDTATILFTTGSTGAPKGVELSHRNVLANAVGIQELYNVRPSDRIVGDLPLFHSFGLTATVWLPMLGGFGAVYHPDPRDYKTVIALTKDYKATIWALTPSLLAPYLDKAKPEDLETVRFVVVGAAKLEKELAERFERKFGSPVLEGYGATELAPVAAVNVPDNGDRSVWQKGQIFGSVGRAMPGTVHRIVDPETLDPAKPLPPGQTGVLLVAGANVMKGYYNEPDKTKEAVVERGGQRWYNTKDLFKMDETGVLRFVDRADRMVKVKDEYVAMGYVEGELHKAADLLETTFIVVALKDPVATNKLVVLYSGWDGDVKALQAKMKANGVKNLSIPAAENFRKIDHLPLVGIGKPSYKEAKATAERLEAASSSAQGPAGDEKQADDKAAPVVQQKEVRSRMPTFREPSPKPWLMKVSSWLSYVLLRWYFRVSPAYEMPQADKDRLVAATRPDRAFFFAPVHPEFTTDWLLDKQLIDRVAPDTAHWADDALFKLAPGFLSGNNVISNKGGQAAKDFSIRRALMGKGVLLHPEGAVRWTSDNVGDLFDGVSEMAVSAAALSGPDDRPVAVVPLVWKLQYTGDVGNALQAEMDLIEKSLELPTGARLPVPERFKRLQWAVFERQLRRFGVPRAALAKATDFFDAQAIAQAHHLAVLRAKNPEVEVGASVDQTLARLRKAIAERLADRRRKDLEDPEIEPLKYQFALADETARLGKFTRALYGAPLLSQEQVGESLKRLRADILAPEKGMLANKILPRPFGPRKVHVRVPQPVEVPRGAAQDPAAYTKLVREAMQKSLDEINEAIRPEVERYSFRNPFVR